MDESQSIEQLENNYWKDIDFPTLLVEKCFQYRRIPIKDLSIEQVRLLLGQKIGIEYILPRAIHFLQENILAEGNYYPGDLLAAILTIDESGWTDHFELRRRFDELLVSEISKVEDSDLLRMLADYRKGH
jgi:hypothetical protein